MERERSALYWEIYERLLNDGTVAEGVPALVEAALEGPAELEAQLAGSRAHEAASRTSATRATPPPSVFVSRIAITGFRGVGPTARLDLDAKPGLTLVVGRNGSGKSSFAEGLELLLTGDNLRWSGRSVQWAAGWRNLHDGDRVELEAQMMVDGVEQAIRLSRRWGAEDQLGDGGLQVRHADGRSNSLDELGWADALKTHRPFLSYRELGAVHDNPSVLHDQIKSILGLEELSAAQSAMAQARLRRAKLDKAAKANGKALLTRLGGVEDPRATSCRDALSKRRPDLYVLEVVLLQTDEATDDDELAELRRLAGLKPPAADAVLVAVEALRSASAAREAVLAATEHNMSRADVLDGATRWFEQTRDADCPVCGTVTVLDDAWLESARSVILTLREQARTATKARNDLAVAMKAARDLVERTPEPSSHGVVVTALERAVAARQRWSDAPAEGAEVLAAHLEGAWDELSASYQAVRDEAAARLEMLNAAWRPVQRELAAWLSEARNAEDAREQAGTIKKAEAWMKATEAALRSARLKPIESHIQDIWRTLRQQSNVDLQGISLGGSGNRRHLDLQVQVDGEDHVALGVMSQGELNALGLALFLPRLTVGSSPFGFVMIDDPVQAMDPSKVDGLARVLEDAAQTRQVVVFTHDTRLPEAVRRLGVEARVVAVSRGLRSAVSVDDRKDPVQQYLDDALGVVRDQDALGPALVAEIVPLKCKNAVEAALKRLAWRAMLARGDSHADIAEALEAAHSLNQLATLALFGDPGRGADTLRTMNNRFGRRATDTFVEVRDHAHGPMPGVNLAFVEQTRLLTRALVGAAR